MHTIHNYFTMMQLYELERFLDKYKNHPNTDYAYYLLSNMSL